jgi:thiosulfate reductase cytochrome b subunit
MAKKIYIHPLPVRIWHWIHAAGIVLLVLSGIQIRYVDHISFLTFEEAIKVHNVIGIIVLLDFALWFLFYTFTGKIKIYFPAAEELIKGSIRQAMFYGYGIFKGDPNPHKIIPDNKFNPMQKQAYLMIMLVLLPVQIITGLLLWKPVYFSEIINFFGGIKVVDTVHVLLFFFFASFVIAHVYLATLGHTFFAHFKAMFTGYEEEEEH